ncbi:hypothetical protein LCGC14_1106710 [marine sediment metagenome]|uniref:Uncharacterized protein n=1 Tax=marine sediment metagenome TaxID=412755 RepID=A0A0F9M7W6_9ZZZZ
MGDIADAMLDGTLCAFCGEYLDREPTGNPEYCDDECRESAGGNPEDWKEMKAEIASWPTLPKFVTINDAGIADIDMLHIMKNHQKMLKKALETSEELELEDIVEVVILDQQATIELMETFQEDE